MIWWRRCLVLVPVLSFLVTALLLSCGGGGGGGTTPTAGVMLHIVAVQICAGTPAPTSTPPTPTPTKTASPKPTKTPTPTVTPQCTPIPGSPPLTVGIAPPNNAINFNAQGEFFKGNNKKKPIFNDVTGADNTLWFDLNGDLRNVPHTGQWQGIATGCDCVSVTAGGIQSANTVSVAVGGATGCTPCPTPSGTPTP
jgi:hypothetical protein